MSEKPSVSILSIFYSRLRMEIEINTVFETVRFLVIKIVFIGV